MLSSNRGKNKKSGLVTGPTKDKGAMFCSKKDNDVLPLISVGSEGIEKSLDYH